MPGIPPIPYGPLFGPKSHNLIKPPGFLPPSDRPGQGRVPFDEPNDGPGGGTHRIYIDPRLLF